VWDENKAPNTNEVNNVAKQNIQAPSVKKEKNPEIEFINNTADSEISLIRLLKGVKLRYIASLQYHFQNYLLYYALSIKEHCKEGTTENLTEEEKIMLMMKESTEAYDPK
ncbi:hypothetical protein T02_10394, partial [Trichinella nativa]